jgi:hypothetical protein
MLDEYSIEQRATQIFDARSKVQGVLWPQPATKGQPAIDTAKQGC